MKKMFTPDEFVALPSLHDCEVTKVTLEDNALTFTYTDLQRYDSIQNQKIPFYQLRLTFYIEDFDFSYVNCVKHKKYSEKPIRTFKGKEYDISYFIKDILEKELPLATMDILTSWKNISVRTEGRSHSITFNLFIKEVIFEWSE